MATLTLYTYCRSSAAYRVRIALAYKNLSYHARYVHLIKGGGEHRQPEYMRINPQGLIPALTEDEEVITQSVAILEYLEERFPDPPLLPTGASTRASVRSFVQSIASDIHPLNNLRVLKYLENRLEVNHEQRMTWYCHWIMEGFDALEERLNASEQLGKYSFGEIVTMADVCLIPQVYNAKRFGCNLETFPRIQQIFTDCMMLPAFHQAAPEQQQDFGEP